MSCQHLCRLSIHIYILIGSQGIGMYLYTHRARRMVARSHLVQTKHLASRIVELIMVDLDMCESSIELDIYIALPGRKLESRHAAAVILDVGVMGR